MPGGEAAQQHRPAILLCHCTTKLQDWPKAGSNCLICCSKTLFQAFVLVVLMLMKYGPPAHDKASTACALLPLLAHICTGCPSARLFRVGSSKVLHCCPQVCSSYTSVWHLCRDWSGEKQEWGWSREPPVSQQRGGDPNSPKKIRKKVGIFLLLRSGSSRE